MALHLWELKETASLTVLNLQAELKDCKNLNVCKKSTNSGLTLSLIVGPQYYCSAIGSVDVDRAQGKGEYFQKHCSEKSTSQIHINVVTPSEC